jgi:hypothetical protein
MASIGLFYFALLGHYYIAITPYLFDLTQKYLYNKIMPRSGMFYRQVEYQI